MADADLDAVRRSFVDLTGMCEDAALIASDGQGIQSFNGGHLQLKRIRKTMDRIRKRLIILEERLR